MFMAWIVNERKFLSFCYYSVLDSCNCFVDSGSIWYSGHIPVYLLLPQEKGQEKATCFRNQEELLQGIVVQITVDFFTPRRIEIFANAHLWANSGFSQFAKIALDTIFFNSRTECANPETLHRCPIPPRDTTWKRVRVPRDTKVLRASLIPRL